MSVREVHSMMTNKYCQKFGQLVSKLNNSWLSINHQLKVLKVGLLVRIEACWSQKLKCTTGNYCIKDLKIS
jgi:hypothetical protein